MSIVILIVYAFKPLLVASLAYNILKKLNEGFASLIAVIAFIAILIPWYNTLGPISDRFNRVFSICEPFGNIADIVDVETVKVPLGNKCKVYHKIEINYGKYCQGNDIVYGIVFNLRYVDKDYNTIEEINRKICKNKLTESRREFYLLSDRGLSPFKAIQGEQWKYPRMYAKPIILNCRCDEIDYETISINDEFYDKCDAK